MRLLSARFGHIWPCYAAIGVNPRADGCASAFLPLLARCRCSFWGPIPKKIQPSVWCILPLSGRFLRHHFTRGGEKGHRWNRLATRFPTRVADGLYGGCGQSFSAWSIGMCRSAVREVGRFGGCSVLLMPRKLHQDGWSTIQQLDGRVVKAGGRRARQSTRSSKLVMPLAGMEERTISIQDQGR